MSATDPAVMVSVRPAPDLEQPPTMPPAGPGAHRALVEAIDVLMADVKRLSTIRQLLPHGKHCGCQRLICAAARPTARRAA